MSQLKLYQDLDDPIYKMTLKQIKRMRELHPTDFNVKTDQKTLLLNQLNYTILHLQKIKEIVKLTEYEQK